MKKIFPFSVIIILVWVNIATAKTYNSTDVPETILPFIMVTSTINISDTFSIPDVNVTIDITHTWVGDLYIFLYGPDGTNVNLSILNGGSGDNYTNTTFDDEASTPITSGSPPFTGSFRPEGSLSNFDGKTTNGIWRLYVDNWGPFFGTLNSWSLTITLLATAPSATTNAATNVTSTGATLNGTVNANSASTTVTFEYGLTTSYGTTVTADQSPVTGDSDTAVSKAITGLSKGTTYHYRVVGQNIEGTTNGSDMTFTTSAEAPTVTTASVSSITHNSASGGGEITDTGGANATARGVCWDVYTNPDPDTGDSKDEETGDFGTGTFTASLTGLSSQTRYKVRAYATNPVGTGYGSVVDFWTLSDEPTAHAASFSASTASASQIDLTFSAASTIPNADGYIILQKTGSAPTGTPADATSYSVGNTIGDATVAALITNTSSTSASITGLSVGNRYYFTLIPYGYDGSNSETYNYYTGGSIPEANARTSTIAPRALSLDGDGDYVITSDSTVLDPYPYTFSAWIKLNQYHLDPNTGAVVLANYYDGQGSIFYISDTGKLSIRTRPPYADLKGNTTIPLNQWTHIATTLEGTSLKVYVNGEEDGSRTISEYTGGVKKSIVIAKASWWDGNYFDGIIDEVCIWNVARTQEEIKATMDTTLRGDEEGLVGYWNFDDDTADDLSPFGNDGTLMGDAQIIPLVEPWPPKKITVSKATDFGGGGTSPGTENVRFLQLGVQTDSGTANITGVKAKFTSTSSATNSDISALDVYEDENGNGEIDAEDDLLGTVSNPTLESSATVTGLSFGVTTTPKYLLLVLDIAGGANPSHSAGLELTDNTFITSDGTVAPTNFPIKNTSDTSLPVELSAFSATTFGDNVILKWRTESEVNNVGFSIYRSEVEAGKYIKIAFVNGAGRSAMPTDYQFIDQNAQAGKTYFYYLEDIDIAGERSKSDIINVVVPPAKPVEPIPKEFRLLQNYPNPFNPDTWIPFDLAADATVTIRIYDVNGRLVRQLNIGEQKAGRYLDKDKAAYWNGKDQLGQSVSSGLYFYTLRAGGFDGFDTGFDTPSALNPSRTQPKPQATQPKDFVATRRMVILK